MTSSEELISLMFATGRLIRERVCADGPATSYLHLAILKYISEKKQPLMREIADYLSIAPPSATSLINNLVKQGEVKRTTDSVDRRAVRLSITAKGQKTLTSGMCHKKESMQKVIKGLSEHEREEFKKILEKIIRLSAENNK